METENKSFSPQKNHLHQGSLPNILRGQNEGRSSSNESGNAKDLINKMSAKKKEYKRQLLEKDWEIHLM